MTKPSKWLTVAAIATTVSIAVAVSVFVTRSPDKSEVVGGPQLPPENAERIKITSGILTVESTFEATAIWEEQTELTVAPSGEETVSQSVITDTPVSANEPAPYGSVIIETNYRPVFLLEGPVPLIRDLGPGDTGEDVGPLQAALTAQGYPIDDEPNTFGSSTGQAIKNLYEDRGYVAPVRTPDELAPAEEALVAANETVTQLETAVAEAQQLLAQAEQQPPDTPANPSAGMSERAAIEALETELEQAKTLAAEAEDAAETIRSLVGPYLPQSEAIFMTTPNPVVETVNYSIGDVVSPEDPTVVNIIGSVAAYDVRLGRGDELAAGDPVEVTVGGQTFDGEVQEVQERDPGTDGGRSWFAVVTTDEPTPSEAVINNVVATVSSIGETTNEPVYHVPIEALTTDGTGAPAVWLATGDAVVLTQVTTGLIANGSVEIRSESDQLTDDDYVLVR